MRPQLFERAIGGQPTDLPMAFPPDVTDVSSAVVIRRVARLDEFDQDAAGIFGMDEVHP
jgi:hypothetical protein